MNDQEHYSTSLTAKGERFALDEPSPFKFGEWHKKLYRAIQEDRGRFGAREAFKKLTTGRRAMNPSWLLIHLEAEWPEGRPSIPFDGWEQWKDGWEGLRRHTKTLRRIAAKMKTNIGKAKCGPAPLAIVGYDRWNSKYQSSVLANHLLSWFAGMVESGVPLIEYYCDMHKDYLFELRKSPSIRRQWHRTIGLLRAVREQTGHYQFARVAALVNVGRKLTGVEKEETAESLRKLWKRHLR